MTEDQEHLAECYCDCRIEDLRNWIGSKKELDRINEHRSTSWVQEKLDEVLAFAIKLQIRNNNGV